MKNALLLLAATLLVSCVTATASETVPAPQSDLLGIRLDMPRDEVRSSLATVARLEREERRRHEIWTLNGDPRYASLIIGYSPEWKVRFVTAVAKPEGQALRYADVIDLANASHQTAGATHTYTWKTPAHYVIAIGNATRIDYLSLKK